MLYADCCSVLRLRVSGGVLVVLRTVALLLALLALGLTLLLALLLLGLLGLLRALVLALAFATLRGLGRDGGRRHGSSSAGSGNGSDGRRSDGRG